MPRLRQLVADVERLVLSTLGLYEWLFSRPCVPRAAAVPFGTAEAERAAALYRALRRPRGRDGRDVALAIAACAVTPGASLWTLNVDDFAGIPGLALFGGRTRSGYSC